MNKAIVCKPSGRLGNAIFRYLASCVLIIKNNFIHTLQYKLQNTEPTNTVNEYFFLNAIPTIHTNVIMDGFFQFDYIYLKYKTEILNFITMHKNEHSIQTDRNDWFTLESLVDDMALPFNKIYDISIHIRLDDFAGRPDYIEYEYYEKLFKTIDFANKNICIVIQAVNSTDVVFLNRCESWFKHNNYNITIESNDLLTDFNIMKQSKELICSMSTLSWAAAYFSKQNQKCYMPNYNLYKERPYTFFKQPTINTIPYDVKTTNNISKIKLIVLTLKEYPSRLNNLESLISRLSQIGLNYEIFYGVNGINITTTPTDNEYIRSLSVKDATYLYDRRVRINKQEMTKGEMGAAISHLNIYSKLISDTYYDNYLIIEDDAELVSSLDQLYNTLNNIPNTFDVCHIAKSDWYPFILQTQMNEYFYKCAKQYFNRTTAYVISKQGATKLLNHSNSYINIPCDDLLSNSYIKHDFNLYVPKTYLFHEPENTVSIIKQIN